MGMFGNLIKGATVAKAVQVVQREMKKPENRKRLNDAVQSLKKRRSRGTATP